MRVRFPELASIKRDPDIYVEFCKNGDMTELFSTGLELQTDHRFEAMCSVLSGCSWLDGVETVLDVGCGIGIFGATYKRFFEGKGYVGLEIDPLLLEEAQERFQDLAGFTAKEGDIFTYQDAPYDCLLCVEALQHIYDMDRTFPQIEKLLKKNGFLFMADETSDFRVIMEPGFAVIDRAVDEIHRVSMAGGRNVLCMEQIEAMAAEKGWQTVREGTLAADVPDRHHESLFHYWMIAFEFCRRRYEMAFDHMEIIQSFLSWLDTPDRKASITFGRHAAIQKTT